MCSSGCTIRFLIQYSADTDPDGHSKYSFVIKTALCSKWLSMMFCILGITEYVFNFCSTAIELLRKGQYEDIIVAQRLLRVIKLSCNLVTIISILALCVAVIFKKLPSWIVTFIFIPLIITICTFVVTYRELSKLFMDNSNFNISFCFIRSQMALVFGFIGVLFITILIEIY